MNKISKLILVAVIIFIGGCELEKVDYPPEPFIEFRSAVASIVQNSLGQKQLEIKLTFFLIDGDGDVGLVYFDSVYPYDANFFPTLYSIEAGELKIDTTIIVDKYRIPWVGDLGQDNSLKAEIIVDFEYPFNDKSVFPHDSILYSFYMLDRALNKSNVAWTDTILIP